MLRLNTGKNMRDLITRAQKNESKAMNTVLIEANVCIRTYLGRRLLASGFSGFIDDVTQESLLSVFKTLSHFPESKSLEFFCAWCVTIAKRRLADFYRKQIPVNNNEIYSEEILESLESKNMSTEEINFEGIVTLEDLRGLGKYNVLFLKSRGLSIQESAKILNITESTVRSARFRERKRLKLNAIEGE